MVTANYLVKVQKSFFVSVSHQRDAGPNTLPTNRERIFMLILQKIFLVTMSQTKNQEKPHYIGKCLYSAVFWHFLLL